MIHLYQPTDPSALYWLYNAGREIIYVGISFEPRTRIQQHRTNDPWGSEIADAEVEWFPDRPSSEAAELAEIVRLRPRYNTKGLRDRMYPELHQQMLAQIAADDTIEERLKVPLAEPGEEVAPLQEVVDAFNLIAVRNQQYRAAVRRGLAAGVPQGQIAAALGRTREMIRRDALPDDRREQIRRADARRRQESRTAPQ